jgi:hypothetical protein
VSDLRWPDLWQDEAIEAARPFVGSDDRLDILVDDPTVAVSGTRLGGYLFEQHRPAQELYRHPLWRR